MPQSKIFSPSTSLVRHSPFKWINILCGILPLSLFGLGILFSVLACNRGSIQDLLYGESVVYILFLAAIKDAWSLLRTDDDSR
jgi:hypothetical protein